jgi:hypothetical protein
VLYAHLAYLKEINYAHLTENCLNFFTCSADLMSLLGVKWSGTMAIFCCSKTLSTPIRLNSFIATWDRNIVAGTISSFAIISCPALTLFKARMLRQYFCVIVCPFISLLSKEMPLINVRSHLTNYRLWHMGILPDYFPVRLWFFTFIYRLPVLRGRHMTSFLNISLNRCWFGKAERRVRYRRHYVCFGQQFHGPADSDLDQITDRTQAGFLLEGAE